VAGIDPDNEKMGGVCSSFAIPTTYFYPQDIFT